MVDRGRGGYAFTLQGLLPLSSVYENRLRLGTFRDHSAFFADRCRAAAAAAVASHTGTAEVRCLASALAGLTSWGAAATRAFLGGLLISVGTTLAAIFVGAPKDKQP